MTEPTSSKILVIDDNEADCFVLREYLKGAGYEGEIIEVHSAHEALTYKSRAAEIECVFVDYRLPQMDGIELLKQFYDESDGISLFPIVMLTGQGSESVMMDAMRYGAQDYLVKGTLSSSMLMIAMAKAKLVFDLKRNRLQTMTALEQSRTMEAMARLTGGIAHDFNNLLTIIDCNIDLMASMVESGHVEQDVFMKRLEAVDRASSSAEQLIRQLMVFSRQRSPKPEIVYVDEVLENVSGVLRRSLGDDVQYHVTCADDIAEIEIDSGQLERALINITLNARAAMPEGGRFTVVVENVDVEEKHAAKLSIDTGPYVRIQLSDTGVGISDVHIDKIFQPFYSSKSVGSTTGLGLSMVMSFVRQCGGGIDVVSKEGGGSAFSLFLPQAQSAKADIPVQKSKSMEDARGSETVLVVEDEAELRDIALAILQSAGYQTVEAANGDEAIEAMEQHGDRIDLIFTDVIMPGTLNGVQMATRARLLYPSAKILFTSGFVSDTSGEMSLIEHYDLLNKPYKSEQLLSAIRSVLDA